MFFTSQSRGIRISSHTGKDSSTEVRDGMQSPVPSYVPAILSRPWAQMTNFEKNGRLYPQNVNNSVSIQGNPISLFIFEISQRR